MLNTIIQASFLLIKASLYSIFFKILSDEQKNSSETVLMTLCNFLIFIILMWILPDEMNTVIFAIIPLISASIISAIITRTKLVLSFFYSLVILIIWVKASIFASYLSIILYNEQIALLKVLPTFNILLITFTLILMYSNNLIVKQCINNYNNLAPKVSFNMQPFLFTNTILLLVNFIVDLFAYNIFKDHLIIISKDLKLSIIIFLVIVDLLLISLLKLYNVLIKNNIRLTLVKDIADNDALTGVLSREKGLSILKSRISNSKKVGSPLTICFIDINNLKSVNDRFGHEEGDLLIELVSSTIKDKLRRFDIMCRLGGDEFLVVFDSCTLDDAKNSWERIEKEISNLNVNSKYQFYISVSIGFAQFDEKIHNTIKCLIKEADDEMYRQKKINKFYEKVNKNEN